MTPEVSTAVRSMLIAIGMFGVAKGWYDKEALETLVGNIMTFGGATLSILAFGWGIYAKRSRSKEAQVIAGRVIDAGVRPIAPKQS